MSFQEKLQAAVAEFSDAKAKPTVAALARAHGIHAQILTGALGVYGLIDEPRKRGHAWLGTAADKPEGEEG